MISLERREGRPLRIGHRGAALLAPENTLESFRTAVAVGVDLVEFDVLALDDGELVIAHSRDLHEVSHGAAEGAIERQTLAELRELCPHLPTLDEALEFFADEAPGVGVHVDLKQRSAVHGVVGALRSHGLLDRSFVSSFSWRALRAIRLHEPRIRTGVSFPRDPLRVRDRRGGSPAVQSVLFVLRGTVPTLVDALLYASRSSALVFHHQAITPRVVRMAHRRGVAVVAWTVDDPSDLERVDRAGVDAVVSNDPTIFVSTLKS